MSAVLLQEGREGAGHSRSPVTSGGDACEAPRLSLQPRCSSRRSGGANSPPTPPTAAGVSLAGRERELKPPGRPGRSARPRHHRAERRAPGSLRCPLATMRSQTLLLLLLPVLGGLGGSTTGEWGPRGGTLRGGGRGELGAPSLGVRRVSPVLR